MFRREPGRWRFSGRRRGGKGLLVVLAVAMLVNVAGTGPSSAADSITLMLTKPDGTPFAGSRVAVYIEPYDPPDEYVPQLLSKGTTDAGGTFSFSIPETIQSTLTEATFNALVRGIDPERRWMVDYNIVLPSTGAAVETVPATVSVPDTFPSAPRASDDEWVGAPTVRRVDAEDPDGGDPEEGTVVVEREDTDTACAPDTACIADHVVGTTRRWVKVTQQHLSKGMSGTFSYLDGRETKTQIGAKAEGGAWYIGGWVTELKNRNDEHVAGKQGPFHRVWLARYRYNKYHYVVCNFWGTYCWDAYKWKPKRWTGGIARSDWVASQPPRDPGYSERLVTTYKRDSGTNVTFGIGLRLAGLELSSQAGYSSITRLTWKKISGCSQTRWLYGNGVDITAAKIIYAKCD